MDGVAAVLEGETKRKAGLDHPRAGDLVALAEEDAWFAYYHWEDDERAPEFARCIDIHRKYGYDPAELFFDRRSAYPNFGRLASSCQEDGVSHPYGFDPLDAGLVKGSHGVIPRDENDWPILFGEGLPESGESIEATEVRDLLLNLFSR